ncbi:hypothetical protein TRIUR3_16710 [Triticum urartu]|uniref:Uncharacterized protein n=1 Tax=Triticum urartu TaxID=4572 RepID=M8AX13_TRIUA|nr:hypothetical protein TRIUR3_16710 [Triticum urartu]
MAAAAFSIRGYAASMRGEAAAEGRRPLGIEHLPPIKAPRFRCESSLMMAPVGVITPS